MAGEQCDAKYGVALFIGDAQNKVIFMYSRSTVASAVSCASGNKKSSGVLVGLLPGFLGYSVDFVNFHLLKAIVRNTYSSAVFGIR
ncbi:hypothetical protein KFK09_003160 [Dendrobium nobile]|uniref:Uncharacterized protein n=1 Tax=Dendrobium nobile TaxID=94219 RepID=A0A8T3C9C3_DENNO|nr:hypothetical protein KFK09_003160 [Dendrobium nobile]